MKFGIFFTGSGEIWRKQGDNEFITSLDAGISIDIPLGTHFQYRSIQGSDMVFICVTMPPWSGADEASYVSKGAWTPST